MKRDLLASVVDQRRTALKAAMILADILLIMLAFVFAYWLRYHRADFKIDPESLARLRLYIPPLLVTIVPWVIVLWQLGLYRVRHNWDIIEFVFTMAVGTTTGIFLFLAAAYLFREFRFSRLLIANFWVTTIFLMLSCRLLARMLLIALLSTGIGLKRIVLVGDSEAAHAIERTLRQRREFGYKVVGYIVPGTSGNSAGNEPAADVFHGDVDAVFDRVLGEDPHELIVTFPVGRDEDLLNLMAQCQKHSIGVRLVPDLYEVYSARMKFDTIGDVPLLSLEHARIGWLSSVLKRTIDIVVSAIALVLGAPLLALAGIIKSGSTSLVVAEPRVGRNERVFGLRQLNADSLRGRPFGRLRLLHLLPPMVNVLRGDMSLVGPRPETPQRVAGYNAWEKRKFYVRPGLFGYLPAGVEQESEHRDEQLLWDIEYVERQSTTLDIAILWRRLLRRPIGETGHETV